MVSYEAQMLVCTLKHSRVIRAPAWLIGKVLIYNHK